MHKTCGSPIILIILFFFLAMCRYEKKNDLSWTRFVRLAIVYIHEVNRPGSRIATQRGFPPRNFVRDRHLTFTALWSRKLNHLPSEDEEKVRGKRFGIFLATLCNHNLFGGGFFYWNSKFSSCEGNTYNNLFLILHKYVMYILICYVVLTWCPKRQSLCYHWYH